MIRSSLTAPLWFLCFACASGGTSTVQGTEGNRCFQNGTCNPGLDCVAGICYRATAQGTEGNPCYANGTCNTGLDCVTGICRGATVDGGATPDRGSAGSCPCSFEATKRCAGDTIQVCTDQSWVDEQQCEGSMVCALASCTEKGSGCPDAGEYDGNISIAARFEPKAVSACEDGEGRDTNYREDTSESHARSVIFDLGPDCTIPAPSLGLDLNEIFGINTDTTVRSDTSSSLAIIATVPEGKKYQIYRQTTAHRRVAKLTAGGKFVGTATLTDYSFAPDIAIGNDCPVPSNLPPAIPPTTSCATYLEGCRCP